jgi:two-component system LytT family sensor kinase
MNKRATLSLLLAWLLFWAMMVATAMQDFLRNDHGPLWQPVLWESSSAVVATLLLAMQRLATRRHDGLLATPARWFARQALWLPVWWLLFTPLAFGIRHGVYALAGRSYEHRPWPETFLYEDVKISIFFAIFTLITFGVLSFRAAEQANAQLRTAQLHQLTQQMQPHFLFNALNTISSLMHSDVERADATLVQLAEVLRATLDVSGQQQAPLSTELRLLRGYARLMEERFIDRVQLAWQVDPACAECLVPVMSMQPLLENVFKHTVERRRGVTHIDISARREGETLVLAVADDAGRLAPAGPAGIGVRNLRERLQALHGERASLALEQLEPAGVRAEMRLPCAS